MLWLLLLCQRLLLFNSLSSFGSEAVLQLVSHFREKKWKDFRDYSNKPPTLMFLIDLLKLHSVWNITWPHSLTHRNLFPAGRNIWSVCVSVCVCVCVCVYFPYLILLCFLGGRGAQGSTTNCWCKGLVFRAHLSELQTLTFCMLLFPPPLFSFSFPSVGSGEVSLWTQKHFSWDLVLKCPLSSCHDLLLFSSRTIWGFHYWSEDMGR